MKELHIEIIRVANDQQLFPSVGRDLPPDWITLEKALKKHREEVHCMSFKDFEAFAKKCCNLSLSGIKAALLYLDSIGQLRYFEHNPSKYDIFIDLKWLGKLAKGLFRHDLEDTLKFDERYGKYVLEGNFENLKEKLLKEAVLSESLLR